MNPRQIYTSLHFYSSKLDQEAAASPGPQRQILLAQRPGEFIQALKSHLIGYSRGRIHQFSEAT